MIRPVRTIAWIISITLITCSIQTGCTPSADKDLTAAEQSYREKDYKSVLIQSDAILEKTPGSLKAHRLKVLSYIALNSISAALDDYEGLKGANPDIAPQLLQEILIAIFKQSLQDESYFVRSAAIKAIGEMGDPGLLPLIIPSMKDPQIFVRFFTVESFGQLEGPDALKLVMATGNDPDGMVRTAAVKVLADMGEGKEKEQRTQLNNLLMTFTDDVDVTVRLFALAAMSENGDTEAFSKIIDMIKNLSTDALSSGVVALGKSKNRAAVPYLNTFVTAKNKSIRMLAAEAMGEIPAPEFYASLAKALNDPEHAVRAAAATSLGKQGDKKAIPLLEKRISDPKAIVRVAVAEGLKRLGKNKIEIYQTALSDPDYGIRHFAVSSLGRIWGMEGMPLLIRALEDTAPRVRTAAVRAIGEVGNEKSLPLLKNMLKDPDLAVRTYAAGNIGRILNKMSGKVLKRSEH